MAKPNIKHRDFLYLNNANKIDPRTGKSINVEGIIAPTGDDCCLLDCCTKSIKWVSKVDNKVREIKLDALYDLINA